MDIRHLEPGDLDGLLALYQHLHAADAALPGRSVVESVWTELIGNPRYRYYGAFVSDQLVGSCTLTVVPNLTRGCRPYGVIENVVTHAQHRRRGFGRALLHAALAEAWSANCYKVMLFTGRKDEATFKFYAAAGFDREGKQAFVAKPAALRQD